MPFTTTRPCAAGMTGAFDAADGWPMSRNQCVRSCVRQLRDSSKAGTWCGGSEVRNRLAASPQCGLLNLSHTRINKLPVSFRFRSSRTRMLHDETNFGIGTLAHRLLDQLGLGLGEQRV